MGEAIEPDVPKEPRIDNVSWDYTIWKHPNSSGRYMVEARSEGKAPRYFWIVRSTVGQWFVHGDNIAEVGH